MSEPRVGVPPKGDISVKSSVSGTNARYLSMSPRMSAAFASADRWMRSATGEIGMAGSLVLISAAEIAVRHY